MTPQAKAVLCIPILLLYILTGGGVVGCIYGPLILEPGTEKTLPKVKIRLPKEYGELKVKVKFKGSHNLLIIWKKKIDI